ncbi:MAG: ABC transporter ATP-binding protein [Geminicoccaceae bacterium]|nr:ABC transporter ATP-binding protein [Geminicoccaceae bacterium]MCB9945305.1 ABC transporter ATP-binding protein [Geminicoccaceae bacterium]
MRGLIGIFFSTNPARAWLVLTALVLANLVEGLGLATMMPLIAAATEQSTGSSPAQTIVLGLVGWFGLTPDLTTLLVLMVGSIVLKALITLGAMIFVGFTSAEVASDLRRNVVRNLMRVRWRYFIRQPMGRITTVISNDATRAAEAYVLAASFLALAAQSVVFAVVALVVSWELALVAFAMGVVTLGSLHALVRAAKRSGQAQTRRTRDLLIFLSDTLSNLKLIRAMDRQAPFADLLDKKIGALRKALRRQVVARESVANLQDAVMAIFLGSGFYVLYNNFDVPMTELLVSGIVVARTVQTVGKLQKAYQKALLVESAFWSAQELIDETEADLEPNPGRQPARFERRIRFENVRFAHGDHPILHGLDLEVEAGQLTVLTGPSGGGKTTIIDLLLGLHQSRDGDILIDDIPLEKIDLASWRHLVGYVPQDVVLLHDSIRENLMLGDTLPEPRLTKALELSGSGAFVRSLPDGLETVVGERGGRLSGGQRQRLALARALVHEPRLLILDEVTSALDPATAITIAGEIRKLSREIAVLTISHRHELLDVADRIYVVEHGKARLAESALH